MPASRTSPLWFDAQVEWEILNAPIATLEYDEVFVFGSNSTGFHGAGSAGHALRGVAANTWRTDPAFAAMKAAPVGSDGRRGCWAVYGVARGHQIGRAGQSYAVQTIEAPGQRKSTSRLVIYQQLRDLVAFAAAHPLLRFVVTPLGEGYSGYSRAEMAEVWRELHARVPGGIPPSFRFVRTRRDDDPSLT